VHVDPGLLKLPGESEPNVTEPVGAVLNPGAASVTVAVHVVPCPTATASGEHPTEVKLVRLAAGATLIAVRPLLPLCSASPS
jgi:hypothetical protein